MPTKTKNPSQKLNPMRIETEKGPNGVDVPVMVFFTRKPTQSTLDDAQATNAAKFTIIQPAVDPAGCAFRVEAIRVSDAKPKVELKGTSPTDEGRRLNLVLSPELFETLESKSRAKGLKVGQWTRSLIIAALNEPKLQNV